MHSEFRDFLTRPFQLVRKIAVEREKRDDIWAVCTKVTTAYSQTGGFGGGDGNAKDGPLAALSDLSDNLYALRRELEDAEHAVLRLLLVVEQEDKDGERYAALLKKRYVERKNWTKVMSELEDAGYQCGHLQTVYQWHRQALSTAERKWEERNGSNDTNA